MSTVVCTETFKDTEARANAGIISAEKNCEGAEEALGADVVGVAEVDAKEENEEPGATVEGDGGFVAGGGGSKMIPNCVKCVVRMVACEEFTLVKLHPSVFHINAATFQ